MSKVRLDSAQSAVRVAVANALGSALVLGFDECEAEHRPLTQVQRIDMAKMAVMAYDTAIEVGEVLRVDVELDSFRD